MKHHRETQAQRLTLFSILALAATAIAGAPSCSSETNAKPPTTTSTSGGGGASSSSAATTGTGGSSATGTGGATTTATGSGGSASISTGTGAGGSDGGANCNDPSGCYSCAPATNTEFLNACTSAQCSPFNNAARLPLYNGGNLPPVP